MPAVEFLQDTGGWFNLLSSRSNTQVNDDSIMRAEPAGSIMRAEPPAGGMVSEGPEMLFHIC